MGQEREGVGASTTQKYHNKKQASMECWCLQCAVATKRNTEGLADGKPETGIPDRAELPPEERGGLSSAKPCLVPLQLLQIPRVLVLRSATQSRELGRGQARARSGVTGSIGVPE